MREGGLIIVADPGADRPMAEIKTVQCVHCGGHFPPLPSKGRGFCTNCAGPICGAGCATCVPEEILLENYEKGRPLDFRPIVVPGS